MHTNEEMITRFQILVDLLLSTKRVKNKKTLSGLMGDNPQGLRDILRGQKRLTAEHISMLKSSLPEMNTLFITDNQGEPIIAQKQESTAQLAEEQPAIEALIQECILSEDATRRKEILLEVSAYIAALKEQNTDYKNQLLQIRLLTR